MANLPRQIIGSFEDIGKQVGSEVVKAPTEIVGKALESLGASSKGQKGQTSAFPAMSSETSGKSTPLDEFGAADAKTKQTMARRALEYIASKQKPAQPSVRERLEKEEQEKKAAEQKKAGSDMVPLPAGSSKRKRGDLYGASAKAQSPEKKSVRQD